MLHRFINPFTSPKPEEGSRIVPTTSFAEDIVSIASTHIEERLNSLRHSSDDVVDRLTQEGAILPQEFGSLIVPTHTGTRTPFGTRVLTADARFVYIVIGMMRHPGLGPVFVGVMGSGAGWYSVYPDLRAKMTDRTGGFEFNPSVCVYLRPQDLKAESVLDCCVSILRSAATERLVTHNVSVDTIR